MNHESPIEYVGRAVKALGQQAHDSQAMAIWCGDNPRRRELPKAKAMREWSLFIERRIGLCLKAKAGESNVSGLANAILLMWIKDNMPETYSMYERHDQESEKNIAELRQNEPELQPQEEA